MGIRIDISAETPLSDDDRDILAGLSVMMLAIANRQNLADQPHMQDEDEPECMDGTVWAYQRSLATGFIRAASDGSVWLTKLQGRGGNYGGIVRFDGSTWTEILEGRSPLSVAIATDGSVWVEAMSEDEISLYVITPWALQ